MAKLDRLGWAAGLSFSSYGVRVGVRVSDPQALGMLPAFLPPSWKVLGSSTVDRLYSLVAGSGDGESRIRRFNVLYGDEVRLARSMNLSEVLESFESDLQLYVAERARRRLFVHAGVVGWRGGAIVMPGRSFSGKSTLVAALVGAGATYYSDEYAILGPGGRVHPYPRPLSLRGAGQQRAGRSPLYAQGTRLKPLPMRLLLVTAYHPERQWRPQAVSAGQGMLALLANTVPARRRPGFAMSILSQAVAGIPVVRSWRGEAQEVADSVIRLFA